MCISEHRMTVYPTRRDWISLTVRPQSFTFWQLVQWGMRKSVWIPSQRFLEFYTVFHYGFGDNCRRRIFTMQQCFVKLFFCSAPLSKIKASFPRDLWKQITYDMCKIITKPLHLQKAIFTHTQNKIIVITQCRRIQSGRLKQYGPAEKHISNFKLHSHSPQLKDKLYGRVPMIVRGALKQSYAVIFCHARSLAKDVTYLGSCEIKPIGMKTLLSCCCLDSRALGANGNWWIGFICIHCFVCVIKRCNAVHFSLCLFCF